MNKAYYPIILLLLTLFNCTENIDFQIEKEESNLVIVGSITSDSGPYTITISRTVGFFDKFDSIQYGVAGACVMIISDDGQEEELTDLGYGRYQTSPQGISGVIGSAYTLYITTPDGENYKSSSERIKESPAINDIFFKEKLITKKNEDNVLITSKVAEIFIKTNDIPNDSNYYYWNWSGTYLLYSHPELFDAESCPPPVVRVCPPPCLNYYNGNSCDCCTCWVTVNNNNIQILDDQLLGSTTEITQKVAEVLINSTTLEDKYYISVEQRSLSKSAFEFWENLKKQENTSTLFATPSTRIESNIININNPDELVYGYFSAYGVSDISFFIHNSDVSEIPFDSQQFIGDCRDHNGSTDKIPDFW